MSRLDFWRVPVALLVIAVLVGCSGTPRRRDRAVGEEAVIEYEEFTPTTAERLPEPRIGESSIVDEGTIDTEADTDRGERIADEVYIAPPEGQLQTVYFDFDKYHLRADTLQTLKTNAAYLINAPSVRVLVEGHCDDRGSQEYNLSLGEKRSKEVRDYLLEAGIHPDRVKIISYGEERPAAPNGTEEGWAQNRRAEFKVAR